MVAMATDLDHQGALSVGVASERYDLFEPVIGGDQVAIELNLGRVCVWVWVCECLCGGGGARQS